MLQGSFTDDDRLSHIANSEELKAEAACPTAGTYTLGAKIKDCNACGVSEFVGNDPAAVVGAIIKDRNKFHVDIGTKKEWRAPDIELSEGDEVYYHFETSAASQVPHFDIDKCATCGADNYDYFWGEEGKTGNGTEVTADATNNIKFTAPAAGKYWMRVSIKSGFTGTSSSFESQYKLNASPDDSIDFPEATCPKDQCSAPDLASCESCTDEGCNWCGGSEFKCTEGQCQVAEDLVADEDKCPDLGCDKFETCAECGDAQGCVWCDTLADTIGIGSSGACSTGKGGLGTMCKSPAATPRTSADQCDSSSSDNDTNGDGDDGAAAPDVNVCDFLDTCAECADVDGCVWCDSIGDTLGLGSSGSCSKGKNGDGKECKLPTADARVDPAQCPGNGPALAEEPSSAVTASISMFALGVIVLFIFQEK